MKVHFVGAGGKGIAPAVSLALQAAYEVTGDDLSENHRTRALRDAGASIEIGANRLPDGDYSSVVASGAFKGNLGATADTTPVLERLQFVQQVLAERDKDVLAVCGSVGKSTAASIIYAAFQGAVPSCYIGADLEGMLCGADLAAGPWAITEACEYQDSYFALRPRSLVLLNITPNHEDHFGGGTLGFARSFQRLVETSADSVGHIVLTDQAAAVLRQHELAVKGQIVGSDDGDWRLTIDDASPDTTRFSLAGHGLVDRFELPLQGTHAALAAALGIVAARLAGLDDKAIQEGLETARLPDRRMSVVFSSEQVVVYDDNARLPLQLGSLLDALRQRHPDQQVVALISPWGRRNRRNLAEWAPVAAKADFVYVLPVGDASTAHGGAEDPAAADDLADLVGRHGGAATAINGVDEVMLPSGDAPLPQVYVTAGYDSNQALFAEAHEHLRR